MYGFIITTHYNFYDTIKKCLDLLFEVIPDNSYVVLYVNETTCKKVLNIKNDYLLYINKFDVIYIKDQITNNGLSGTWNMGINYFLNKKKFNCKVISILGHDTFVNNSIKLILDEALEAENNKKLLYFGPLFKNYEGKNDELWQDEKYYKNYLQKFLIGSFFVFPKNSLIKNQICDSFYFNEIRYPFGYNDIDWYNRFIKIGGKAIIIEKCIIDHKYERSWLEIDKKIKKLK